MRSEELCYHCRVYAEQLASAERDELKAQAGVFSAVNGQQELEASRVYFDCQARIRSIQEEWRLHGLHKYVIPIDTGATRG